MAMSREIGGRTITTVVILGKREVPRGTLDGILRLAEISPAEFTALLRKR
jgi:predicted RNA binding protein YcfA (HicA-like mRNA interferase family)